MRTKNEKIKAGVYLLLCLWKGIGYVGKSQNLTRRFEQNLASLRLNHHDSEELQKDFNEFGADCFVIFPLELVADESQLAARERAWTRKCLIEGKVYNRLNAVTAKHREEFKRHKPKWPNEPAANGAQDYVFISPAGDVMKVKGLRGICEAYDLNPSHLSKVARGIYVQHRGWTSGESDHEANQDIALK